MKVYLLWCSKQAEFVVKELVGVYNNSSLAEGECINREVYAKLGEVYFIEEYEDVEVFIE